MPDNRKDELVTLTEVENLARADLIRSVLQGSGIPSYIPDEGFGQAYGGVFGIKIKVRREDLAKAREVLEDMP
ncbi:MAG: DUF2007 domain-containing protein [Firmicutes bacterium]|nr:DUF2007 domain-containing protein [Bacillota bacterium]